MNKKLSRQQRTSFFLLNISAFASIFILLGLIILQLLNQTAYQETDTSLKQMSQNSEMIEQEIFRYLDGEKAIFSPLDDRKEPPKSPSSNRFNTQVLLWSESGEILNKMELGGRFSELENLRLQTDSLNTIQDIHLAGETALDFHSITQVYDRSGIAYIQIVSNINQIKHSLQTFRMIVILCMIVFGVLSIGVSYWLSSISMKPILKAWSKQQEFVENASHELRTPLTIIQNRLEGLFRKPDQSILAESENIAQALVETRRLTALTSDLLTIARNESNQLVLDKENIETSAFLTTIAAPFQELAIIEQKQFLLELDDLPSVWCDRKKMTQVFIILLDNTLKYTDSNDSIRVVSKRSTHKWWEVHIINTGPSISDEGKKQLFERFYREDKSRSKETGGYGLGLAIAKQIIEEHQGRISVHDVLPTGVDFCLKIPLVSK